MVEWQRSELILYPRIWREFTIFNPIINQFQYFFIMDIPEELHATVIHFVEYYSIKHIPIELRSELLSDQLSQAERLEFFRRVFKQRLSLMCVQRHTDGRQVVVAIDINMRRSIYDFEILLQGELMKWMWSIREHIYAKKPFYTIFKVTEVMLDLGSYINPELSETIVPVEMFKCRELLCKATEISLSFALFEIREGQYNLTDAAFKAGFMEFVRVPYEELASLHMTYQLPKCEMFTLFYNFYQR